jgi:hypothetical protein
MGKCETSKEKLGFWLLLCLSNHDAQGIIAPSKSHLTGVNGICVEYLKERFLKIFEV